MADNLTAAQRTAFKGPIIDLSGFAITCTLSAGITTMVIDDRVQTWGRMKEKLIGWSPRQAASTEYPTLQFTLDNTDGKFSEGTPASLWTGHRLADFSAEFEVTESLSTGSPVVIYSDTFVVWTVEATRTRAILTCLHPLATYWGGEFTRDDHYQEVDWNGETHNVTI